MDLRKYIANVENYPKKGISFKDITPLMADGRAYKYTIERFEEVARKLEAEVIVGPEARGFITGCPVATNLGIGFVPVRKPGKLPREIISQEYQLEYGVDTLTMHKGDIKIGQRVMIVDDLLATGGTMEATIKLIEAQGGIVVGLAFIIELKDLGGRKRITDKYNIISLLEY